MKYHPDKNKSPLAEEIFKKINNSYHVLKEPEEREKYNIKKKQEKKEVDLKNSYKKQHKTSKNDYFYHSNSKPTESKKRQKNEFQNCYEWFYTQNQTQRNKKNYNEKNANKCNHKVNDNFYYYTNKDHRKKKYKDFLIEGEKKFRVMVLFGIIILIVWIISASVFQSSPRNFNFKHNTKYNITRFTKKNNVTYFVNKYFDKQYHSKEDLEKIDNYIELKYLEILYSKCQRIKNYIWLLEREKNRRQYTKSRKAIIKELESIDRTPCKEFENLKYKRFTQAEEKS